MEVVHDDYFDRFALEEDGQMVYVSYSIAEGVMDLNHTYTPPALRGRGLASHVVKAALDYARDQGYKVRPICSYVDLYVRRHKEYQPLVHYT